MLTPILRKKDREEMAKKMESLLEHLKEEMLGANFKILDFNKYLGLFLVSNDGACCMVRIRDEDVLATYRIECSQEVEEILEAIESWNGGTTVTVDVRYR